MKLSLFQSIIMAIFGLGALIGLFVFATYSGKNNGSNTIGTVIVWGTLPQDDMKSVIAGITQIDQSLKSFTYIEKDEATLPADLASAIATGSSPDLVLASQEELLSLTKYLSPIPPASLPARTFQNSFAEGANIVTVPGGGGYWGIPFLIDPLALFSNRRILSSSGIARPPSTWEALTGLVPVVVQFSPTRQIQRGLIALGSYDNVRDARGVLSTLFLQTNVPITGYASSGLLVADLGAKQTSGVPMGQAVTRFYTQFADPTKVSYTWNAALQNSEQAFLAGDLALSLGYVSRARFLKTANPNLDFDVAPAPQPATAVSKTVYGLIYTFMAVRGAKNPSGAYQAAVLFSNPAEQAIAAANTGLAPASLTELSRSSPDPILAVAYAEALYTRGWLSPAPSLVDPIFSGMINNVISGRTTLDTALGIAERSLSALLMQ